MTCREFERWWSAGPGGELPAAARGHLAGCSICAAMAQSDRETDAMLRRVRAGRPPVDAGTAWPAIERALAERASGRAWWEGRRALALAGAGLAAAAAVVIVVFLSRPTGQHRGLDVVAGVPVPGGAEKRPGASPGSVRPTVVHPTMNGGPALRERPINGPAHSKPVSGTQAHLWAFPKDRPVIHGRGTHGRGTAASVAHPTVHAAGARVPSVRSIIHGRGTAPPADDLTRLNQGHLAAAGPVSPLVPPETLPEPLPLVEARRPGSLLLDDLLNLNPVLLAGAGDAGLGAAARTLAAEAPATDARLQQKVFVHATMEKLSDVLAGLSKATGVTLVPRLEVAGERVSVWEEDRPLMDVMRDLRHLHGWFWSRAKQGDRYVYSLWQDAQSRAREDAELQRQAMEQHRQFEEEVWKHVRALHASDEELKKMGRDDPFLIAQMLHPLVKNAYRLFAALSPDQQAQLTKGQTPSVGGPCGMELLMIPPADAPFPLPPFYTHMTTPRGDMVTLTWDEMSLEQRHTVEDLLTGSADWTRHPGRERPHSEALQTADPKSAAVTLFRVGDPGSAEGLSLRVDFQSGGKRYGLYSNFALPPSSEEFYNDWLRKGEFHLWQGAQEEVSQALEGNLGAAPPAPRPAAAAAPPDPVLDARFSFTWTLPLREGTYRLNNREVLAAMHQAIAQPLIADGLPEGIEQPRSKGAFFHWEKRPLRELLQRLFPGWKIEADEGAIFAKNPDRLRDRAQQLPIAVEEFLEARTGTLTLDDMAFLARSLSPGEVTRLDPYLPMEVMDQLLAGQELLKLYGELAGPQRSMLPRALPFTALTPPQQRLFLQFAQRQRPYVEPWRFQNGGLRLSQQPPPPHNPHDEYSTPPVARLVFQVQFQDGDVQPFPVDLYAAQDQRWNKPLSTMIGKPFPFPTRRAWLRSHGESDSPTAWEPALADPRLRKRAMVIFIAWPFAEPYAGTQPSPAADAWARALAGRLHEAGVTVVHVGIGASEATPAPVVEIPGHLIRLTEPGTQGGAPFGPKPQGNYTFHWPSVVVVGRDEIVRAVFEGPEAWDMAAVERAARVVR